MSRTHNPHGYVYAASGLVICTGFLIPVGGRLRYVFPRNWATHLAAILFVIGISTLAFLGLLSFVMDNLGTLHDSVTAVSLLAILISMFLYLTQISITRSGRARMIAAVMIFSLLGIVVFLSYAGLTDYLNTDTNIWHSLAAWEWSVISYITLYLFALLLLSSRISEVKKPS
jgi:hypothetical protein